MLIVRLCYIQLLTYFSCPKVAATRKLLPLRPANSESNGGCRCRNFTVLLLGYGAKRLD